MLETQLQHKIACMRQGRETSDGDGDHNDADENVDNIKLVTMMRRDDDHDDDADADDADADDADAAAADDDADDNSAPGNSDNVTCHHNSAAAGLAVVL